MLNVTDFSHTLSTLRRNGFCVQFQTTKINLMVIYGFVTAWWNVISKNADQVKLKKKIWETKNGWETKGVLSPVKRNMQIIFAVIRSWNDELGWYEISAAVIDQFYEFAFIFKPACSHISFQASKWSLACEEHAVIICCYVFSSSLLHVFLLESLFIDQWENGLSRCSRVCILIWLFRRVFQQQPQSKVWMNKKQA